MKFRFKIQDYQTDAVNNIIRVFNGQPYNDGSKYRRDLGKKRIHGTKLDIESGTFDKDIDIGYKNNEIELDDKTLLKNINLIQSEYDIEESSKVDKSLGCCSLDIEMETGTGKTYVYTKMMFELNKHYGWSKFIVVVPSIAIREGVWKSMKTTEDHFMEQYGKKLRFFTYNSSDLHKLDEYSQNSGINVMIINSQAFARELDKDKYDKDLAKGKKKKGGLIIFEQRDEFGSRAPIDVIAANRPIVILDEPQKLGKTNSVTQRNLKEQFNVLFSVNFSAPKDTLPIGQ